MEVAGILKDCRQRMDKSLDYFQRELRGIRTGRATTALIDYIKVDYYGSPTELRELAAISVPEPTLLLVKPFDPTSAATIIKALETADLVDLPARVSRQWRSYRSVDGAMLEGAVDAIRAMPQVTRDRLIDQATGAKTVQSM